ncbi:MULTISPECIES: long-chain-fatty-acid--CoA ligase [unclassified Rhodococcus (in: high G+C Gram-positive bacteria)]|uniref:long-chain-fatty-acid--CoA ligase n=1 Tax=unclassified Rhodococcus (in: high G+C Gram-positive bacteria) TaxID=192944 RepID=UPI00163A0BB1|nr:MULTISPECIES: long-chain-fatty-acid--CoA ligase [unclassified Rhodococcus (in: high G+C Gram-positive bacteria)]MBC2637690.1 long-chain-fatty-acid--CoA ligase [Rhodococcus sp. 3A]MBC2897566.1 long-chain-fatty-acid--CoA ligase [Rhodococcus sp. 4CII]
MRVHELLDHWAERTPDEIYLSDDDRSLTWEQVRLWTHRIGNWLAATLQPGDRFAVLDRNSLEMVALYFGASRAGVVPVPLNFRLAPPEWKYIVEDAGCGLAVVHEEYADPLTAVLPDLAVSVLRDDAPSLVRFSREALAFPDDEVDRDISPDAVYHQMYTSGTTGKPKGAMVTHRAACTNALQIQMALDSTRKATLCVMPLFHAGAALQILAYTSGGCSIHVVRNFDQTKVRHRMADRRIRLLTLAPAMIQTMIADPLATRLDLDALETVVYGSAPMAVFVLERAIEVFGSEFIQAYGMTESCAVATILTPEDHNKALESRPEILASAGRPVLGTAIRVVDRDGRELPRGQVGEIVVRGPQLMIGYWNLADASRAALAGGWLHTGDAGYVDEDGYLYISDRVKDMIISGGENIYPREVEEVLFAMDEIADVAVIGVPSERWGESPVAVVVTAPGATVDEQSVLDHCRAHLARFKCPIAVTFVDALPRSAVGKVLKRELREPYRQNMSRSVT